MPMGGDVSLPSQSSSRWLAQAAAMAAATRGRFETAHAAMKTMAIAPMLWVYVLCDPTSRSRSGAPHIAA